MALIVQGSTDTVGANAYLSLADFKAYHEARGVDLSDYDDAGMEASIVKATQYVDIRFAYKGQRTSKEQELQWPREFCYNDRGDSVDGVPKAVKNATAEYALRSLVAPLLPDPAAGAEIKSKKEKVGEIEEETEYVTGQTLASPEYPLADRILQAAGLVDGGVRKGVFTTGSLGRA